MTKTTGRKEGRQQAGRKADSQTEDRQADSGEDSPDRLAHRQAGGQRD